MRKLRTTCRLAVPLAIGALALGGAGCSRRTGSGDDSQPVATPAPTAPPAPTATATATATTLTPGVYPVNKPIETDPDSVLTKVTVAADATTLDFTFTNQGKGPVLLTVAKPGSREAMFLEQAGGGKAVFLSATGIATQPAQTKVAAGASLQFTAVFGPLDPGSRKFSLYEGEDAKKAMPGQTTYWVLHDVEL